MKNMEKDVSEKNVLRKVNKEALEKVCLAQPILNKIVSNPQLANVHDISLLRLGESRWNRHFVMDTLIEIMDSYKAERYNNIESNAEIPEEVKEFVRTAYNYKFGILI